MDEISQYEQDRLDRIAENEKVLASLGLSGDNRLQQPKPVCKKQPRDKKDDDPKPPMQNIKRRCSARQSNAPVVYTELSDEFCREEERNANRPRRQRKRPDTYEAEQAREQEAANARLQMRRDQVMHNRAIMMSTASGGQERRRQSGFVQMRDMTMFEDPLPTHLKKPYHTDGRTGQCPRCLGIFVLRKDNTMRDHVCEPPQAMLPAM